MLDTAPRSSGDGVAAAPGAESLPRSILFGHVCAIVARIPRGRVTTYGAIAHALGAPRAARSVGWALSVAPAAADLPCHRVVDRTGFLSGGWHWGHPDVMASLLHEEGVPFLEPHRVDLRACLWRPDDEDQPLVAPTYD